MSLTKPNKFEVPIDRLLSDSLTFHQSQNIMKTFRIQDEAIAQAISLTVRDSTEEDVQQFVANLKAEEEIIKNDLDILENTSEVVLNRE
jgi:uncharacterized membrane protein